jgi:hypothetical protein
MLHENPSMLDIDVNHWRNLQALLLESAKEKRRIVLIHESGEVLKLVHSRRAEIVGTVREVDDPHAVAERLYRDNADKVDFVAVFERRAFAEWAGRFQDSWSADEDLDEFVYRQYALMDEYPDGIVTYPGPARTMLGLQWRVGASYEAVKSAVRSFVTPESTVVLGAYERDALWAVLVLHFDADHRADVVTTLDPSRVSLGGGRAADARAAVEWAEATYGPCSVALFADLADARAVLAREDKAAAFAELMARDGLLIERAPAALRSILEGAIA